MKLSERELNVLYSVIELYLETHLPISSLMLSRFMKGRLSSASLRLVMAELEEKDFLHSLHTSSGRLPTTKGLNLYIRNFINTKIFFSKTHGFLKEKFYSPMSYEKKWEKLLEKTIQTLSELSRCASVVIFSGHDPLICRIEFIYLSPGEYIAILVTQEGKEEKRFISVPQEITSYHLEEAVNYLNTYVVGCSLKEALKNIEEDPPYPNKCLHFFSDELIRASLNAWALEKPFVKISGYPYLLDSFQDIDKLKNLKELFFWIESQEIFHYLNKKIKKDTESYILIMDDKTMVDKKNFKIPGCSLIFSSYNNNKGKMGAIGVMGPVYMNYKRIIPMVNFTAQFITEMEIQ